MFTRSGHLSLVSNDDGDLNFTSIFGRKRGNDDVTWTTPARDQLPKIKVEPMFRDKLEHILRHRPEPDPGEEERDEASSEGEHGAQVSTLDTTCSTLDTSAFGQYDLQSADCVEGPTRIADDESEGSSSDTDSAPIRSPFDIRLYAGALSYNSWDRPRNGSVFDSNTFNTFETFETIAFSAESSVSDTDWHIIPEPAFAAIAPDTTEWDGRHMTAYGASLHVPSTGDDRRGSIRSSSSKKSVTFSETAPVYIENAPVYIDNDPVRINVNDPEYIDVEPSPDYEDEIKVPAAPMQDSHKRQGTTRGKDIIRLREIYGKPIVSSTAVAKVNPIYVEDRLDSAEEQHESLTKPEVALSINDTYLKQLRIEKYRLKSDVKNNNDPLVDVGGKEPHDIDGIWTIDKKQSISNSLDYELRGYDTLIKKTLDKERRRKTGLLIVLAMLVFLFLACGIGMIVYFAKHAS